MTIGIETEKIIKRDELGHVHNTTHNIDDVNRYGGMPTVSDFYRGLSPLLDVAIAVAGTICVAILLVYCCTVRNLLKNTPRKYLARSIVMCSAYPAVAAASVTSILVPRSVVLCDTICHLTFAILAYQFFCLTLNYTNGESNFVKEAGNSKVFNIRSPPCCCWMFFLSPRKITKQKLLTLRLMVLQMPIVQSVMLIALNIINIEDSILFERFMIYLGPFMAMSILTGVWGLQITTRMIAPLFLEYNIMGKYFAIQLVLIICKLQTVIANAILAAVMVDAPQYPITPRIILNTGVQILILSETLLLSVWALRLYKFPSKLPEVSEEEI